MQHRLCKRLTHLYIDINPQQVLNDCAIISKTFALILSLCDKLIELEFSEYVGENMRFIPQLDFFKINFLSTTLTKLKITVACYYDCLYLLDGRLESLSVLIINVGQIFDPVLDIGHKVNIGEFDCLNVDLRLQFIFVEGTSKIENILIYIDEAQ